MRSKTRRRLEWLLIAVSVMAFIGAAAGSGGTPKGLVAAFVINPMTWLAAVLGYYLHRRSTASAGQQTSSLKPNKSTGDRPPADSSPGLSPFAARLITAGVIGVAIFVLVIAVRKPRPRPTPTFEEQVEASGDVHVDGHMRNGRWIEEHARSQPDGLRSNNYSYPGNTNPWKPNTRSQQSSSSDEELEATMRGIRPLLRAFDEGKRAGLSDDEAYRRASENTRIRLVFD